MPRFEKGNPHARHGNGSKGRGYGGPANGASTSRIKPGDPDGIQAMSNDAEHKAHKAALRDRFLGKLEAIALNDPDATRMEQIQACVGGLRFVAPSADAELAAETRGAISREPMTVEEWNAKHGPDADLGAAGGTAGRTH